MDKNNIELWIFSLDDPQIYKFYTQHANNTPLYYILYIKDCRKDYSMETKNILHLKDNSILLLDTYLVPLFCHLQLNGYLIVLSEAFCEYDKNKALLKLCFFHDKPEGIIDMGCVNESQKICMELLYTEYCSPYDDGLQSQVLQNLMVNIALLSPVVSYKGQFKSGHYLNYALQFTDLAETHAFSEKKRAFYAGKIGITEKELSKSLQLIFHKSFKEILSDRVQIKAMNLLVFSDKTITQIARELGFELSHFLDYFYRKKGMYPKDFRQNIRKIINEIENGYEDSTLQTG
ncbi:helix-turn-helix domain-containing protein [Dysgonomonas reticulitermitis]